VDKFLQQLADRLQIPDSEIITADETKDWPTGKLDELVEAGVLAEIQHSKGVVCRECEENCFIEPDIRTNPDTGKASGIFVCTRNPDIGRIEVDLDRLRQWQINSEKLPKPKKINKTATYSRKNQKQNEKTLIVSTLLEYHRFGMDSEFNFELLKQEKLGEKIWVDSIKRYMADDIKDFINQLSPKAVAIVHSEIQNDIENGGKDSLYYWLKANDYPVVIGKEGFVFSFPG